MLLIGGCDRIREWRAGSEQPRSVKGQASPDLVYQTVAAELKLAQSSKPYLVLDMVRRALELRLKGALVLTTPLNLIEVDSTALPKFAESFAGEDVMLVRRLAGKYLFGAQDKTPDSVLTIVSNVINVKPELLQREIPSRFRLFWDDKLILDVVSDVEATPVANLQEKLQGKLQNTITEARYVLRRPFGARLLVIKVQPDDALTLYRVTEAGMPTLLKWASE